MTHKPTFTLTGIKRFLGREGHGLNATIKMDGKAVATVLDSGNGGETTVDWYDGKRKSHNEEARKACAEVAEAAYIAAGGDEAEVASYEAMGMTHMKGLIARAADPANPGYTRQVVEDGFIDWWITYEEGQAASMAQIKRWAKTKTIFRLADTLPNEFRTLTKPHSPAIVKFLADKYGAAVTWVFDPTAPTLPAKV